VLDARSVEAASAGVTSLLARGGRTKVQWLEGLAAADDVERLANAMADLGAASRARSK